MTGAVRRQPMLITRLPSYLRHRWRWLWVLAALVAVEVTALTCVYLRVTEPGPSVQELQSELSSALPPGTSSGAVKSYLADRDWQFIERIADPERDTIAAENQILPGSPLIMSNFIDNQGDRKVTMYFVFDSGHRLERLIIDEQYFGP